MPEWLELLLIGIMAGSAMVLAYRIGVATGYQRGLAMVKEITQRAKHEC